MRKALGIVALGVMVALGAFSYTALAAPPVGCVFPQAFDNLESLPDRALLTEKIINRWQCLLNALQQRALYEGTRETVCQDVLVAAGKRIAVPFVLSAAAAAGTPVLAGVTDTASPGRLEIATESPNGSTLTAWVFNHDPLNARSGRACLQVIRL